MRSKCVEEANVSKEGTQVFAKEAHEMREGRDTTLLNEAWFFGVLV